MESDHYVDKGKYQNWFAALVREHRPAPTHTTGLYSGDNLRLQIWNGPIGAPVAIRQAAHSPNRRHASVTAIAGRVERAIASDKVLAWLSGAFPQDVSALIQLSKTF